MSNHVKILCLAAACTLGVGLVATPARAGIVYLGQDTSDHYPAQPQAIPLTQNAVRFAAGGVANPSILLVGNGSSFGGNTPALLSTAGFTSVTQIAPSALATTNLSNFQVVYFAPTTNQTDVNTFIAQASQVLNYTKAGGGLVVEPEVFATGSWSWVPGAAQLGISGATNVGHEDVVLDPTAPPSLLAGLTSAGLSNWSFSIHSEFATPGAAGFGVLGADGSLTGPGVDIFQAGAAAAVPEPASLALFAIGGLAVAGVRRWRRRTRA